MLWGPTIFNKFLDKIMKMVKEKLNSNIYHILLILTDGEVHDMRQTVDKIVECAELPLSVIIVGIGDQDFKNMEVLDGDDADLQHS